MAIHPEIFNLKKQKQKLNLVGVSRYSQCLKTVPNFVSSYLIMVLYRTVPLESLSAVVWSVCPLPENSSGSPSCVSFQCPEASSERSSLNTCPTKPHGKPCWQCSLEAINIYTESNLKNQHTHTKTYCTSLSTLYGNCQKTREINFTFHKWTVLQHQASKLYALPIKELLFHHMERDISKKK